MSSARQLRRPRRIVLGSVLGVATLLVATACSSSGKPSGKGGGSVTGAALGSTNSSCATAHKKLNLGFVYADTTQNPFQEMALGAQAAADQDGNVNLKENAPTPLNNTQEVSMFQAMARQATDGVAYETVAPDLFYRAVKNATSSGVPVVAVDAAPPKNAGVKLFVANSNTELGRMLGDAF